MSRRNQRSKPGLEDQACGGVDDCLESEGPSLAEIMSELKSQRSKIMNRFDGIDSRLEDVTTQVSSMRETLTTTNQVLEKQQQRMDEAEKRISTLEDTLHSTQRDLHRAEIIIKALESKTDDLENRGRRKNVVLLGLPEKSEGSQSLFDYIQQKLPGWLKLSLDKPIELERAHRSLRPLPDPGKPPRPVLIRFLRFRDKELILQSAKKTSIIEGNAKLTIRQDLSAEVRRKRKEFDRVIKIFSERGLFRGFAYPHRLRILHQNNIVLFEDPKEAESFAKQLE